MTITVVIQERQRLFREGLAILLQAEPDVQVIGAVGEPQALPPLCTEVAPDVALVSLDNDLASVLAAVEAVRDLPSPPRVLAIAETIDEAAAAQAFSVSVEAVVGRQVGVMPVLNALRSPSAHRLVMPRSARSPVGDQHNDTLTAREIEVLRLVSGGLTTAAVAHELGISKKTVENHKQRIFQKLGVHNQAHAVATAMRLGLIAPTAGRDEAL